MPLSLEEKVRLLSMVDVFEALSEEELRRLARLAHDATYERGEVLPEPQEGSEKLYVLKEGRVQLYVKLPNKGEITLSVVEGGSIFGEIAVCRQGSEKVRARARDRRAAHPAASSGGLGDSTDAKRALEAGRGALRGTGPQAGPRAPGKPHTQARRKRGHREPGGDQAGHPLHPRAAGHYDRRQQGGGDQGHERA